MNKKNMRAFGTKLIIELVHPLKLFNSSIQYPTGNNALNTYENIMKTMKYVDNISYL